jgi:hypothetical protein
MALGKCVYGVWVTFPTFSVLCPCISLSKWCELKTWYLLSRTKRRCDIGPRGSGITFIRAGLRILFWFPSFYSTVYSWFLEEYLLYSPPSSCHKMSPVLRSFDQSVLLIYNLPFVLNVLLIQCFLVYSFSSILHYFIILQIKIYSAEVESHVQFASFPYCDCFKFHSSWFLT